MKPNINSNLEYHPFEPLIFPTVKVMMIGSFPPARSKWRMEFYYPNFQNDMWRIFGLVFFEDKDYFIDKSEKSFNKELLLSFLVEKGIGIADMGKEIIRLKENASDKHLEIVKPLNFTELIVEIPKCYAFITTGEKATEILILLLSQNLKRPPVGGRESFHFIDREFNLYRLPSSSRAYPMPLAKKAEMYKQCLKESGVL
ncbi:MAG: uracil-DNA glycosylase family protein [Candidatus Saccharimonadaceae bacterium]